MRNIINIQGYNQTYGYMLEYSTTNIEVDYEINDDIRYFVDGDTIHIHSDEDTFFRVGNEWYYGHDSECVNTYVPRKTDLSMVRLYFPNHSADSFRNGVTYMVSFNTWIGGYKVELGSFKFNRLDAIAIEDGVFEHGLERYYDCVEFNVIDPYDLIYSDHWEEFRKKVCGVNMNSNNVGSILNATLYVVTDNGNGMLMIDDEFIGGSAAFNIAKESTGFLNLHIEPDLDNLGWKFVTSVPKSFCTDTAAYNRLFNYINKTYTIPVSSVNNVKYEIIAKNNNSIIQGPAVNFSPNPLNDPSEHITQTIGWDKVLDEVDKFTNPDYPILSRVEYIPNPRSGLRHFFSSWNSDNDGWPHFEEGWFIQGSLTIELNGDEVYILSNEVPITQEIFKYFVGWDKEELNKRYKVEDMEIKNYTLVNKVINEVVQIDRPENSKSNIIQPVFFKVKDTEMLTIHTAVTENICVNLDDYKSKVDVFHLQIENCRFNQIGANQYGIVFKVVGTSLPKEVTEGTYYILNEDYELVTTGKYKYV